MSYSQSGPGPDKFVLNLFGSETVIAGAALFPAVRRLSNAARSEIIIAMQHLTLTKPLTELLGALSDRGVAVTILFNHCSPALRRSLSLSPLGQLNLLRSPNLYFNCFLNETSVILTSSSLSDPVSSRIGVSYTPVNEFDPGAEVLSKTASLLRSIAKDSEHIRINRPESIILNRSVTRRFIKFLQSLIVGFQVEYTARPSALTDFNAVLTVPSLHSQITVRSNLSLSLNINDNPDLSAFINDADNLTLQNFDTVQNTAGIRFIHKHDHTRIAALNDLEKFIICAGAVKQLLQTLRHRHSLYLSKN